MWIYPVESRWAAGDVAYCINAKRAPMLERGRIYKVADARKPSNIAHYGIRLEGVEATDPMGGFWSNRFIKLGPVGGRLSAISDAIRYTTVRGRVKPPG